jgi:hypothetical protein
MIINYKIEISLKTSCYRYTSRTTNKMSAEAETIEQLEFTRFQPFDSENDFQDNNPENEIVRERAYYPSNDLMDYVRNALTGGQYPYRAGTFDSMRLYKVADTTGRCDRNGVVLLPTEKRNPNPNMLFYDSPEQYMKHRKVKVQQSDVNKWYERNTRLFGNRIGDGAFNKEQYQQMVKEGLIV